MPRKKKNKRERYKPEPTHCNECGLSHYKCVDCGKSIPLSGPVAWIETMQITITDAGNPIDDIEMGAMCWDCNAVRYAKLRFDGFEYDSISVQPVGDSD